jgi:D-beta-D-heptose 7-phosphate kinase/D-beta-D-heptose 1-phosphate adenosyltransferase
MDSSGSSLADLKEALSAVRVLVVGDAMLDEYLFGAVSRISPEAPVPVVDVKGRRYVAGGAGNVAANVASLGATVTLLGAYGADRNADLLDHVLAEADVHRCEMIRCPAHPTISKTRVIAGQQQIVRFDCEDRTPYPESVIAALAEKFEMLITSADVCVFSDYGKGVLTDRFCQAAIARANKEGKQTIVDPKGADYAKYRGCRLITPNQREAGEAAGLAIDSEEQLAKAGERLLQQLPGSSVLVTRGPDGMTLFQPGCTPVTVATVAQQVFDVVGAGDTAVAALAVAMGGRLPMESAMRLGNFAAGIAVGQHGTVAVKWEDLLVHPEARALLSAIQPASGK